MSVGLDIGSKTLKIVELSKDGSKFKLRASGIVGYMGETIEHMKSDKELQVLGAAIKKLHKEAKISTKEVAIALPEPQVYMRTVRFPLLTDSEIASAVKWEAEQYIPIPKEEAIIQHMVIERNENTSPPSTIVLLVAAPKALVVKYAKVVESAGLKLVFVETELMSLVRALTTDTRTIMLVDFGARSTDIAIAKNYQLIFSRSIPTAGEAFTRAVSQSLGVEAKQAEEYKRAYGLSNNQLEGKIRNALDPIFRTVADEMKKAIQFYKTDAKGESPQSVMLSGGTAGMPEVASYFTKILGIEVVVGNPFLKVNVDPNAAKSLSGYAPLYAVATGLAMR
ncbi:type IV pilus assembly protein PilM [Candidatus Woesebacteria bacterium]|nr:MAG: type IV pilus assembly protein PilM [Candidatus Woesebacteria bacterium]